MAIFPSFIFRFDVYYLVVELRACKVCKWWRPDAVLVYIGECEKRLKPTRESEGPCEDFAEKVEVEFMWCSECRETFHQSERDRHKGHSVHDKVHVDEDTHEYIMAGD